MPARAEGRKIPGSSHKLLSRYAECAFWLGRYVERADNLARLLSVTEGFAAGDDDAGAWRGVLDTFQDRKAFEDKRPKLTGLAVARWFFLDRDNPNSILSALAAARENARALRHITPIEAWKQINMLYGEIGGLNARQVTLPKLSALCERVRLGCMAHQGLVDGTWYRDEAWLFHRLGAELERADQTTRLLDAKYYQLKSAGTTDADDFSPPDIVWWNSLLRSASSYHAFRRRHALTAGPAEAAAFLLFDRDCPRSVALSANAAADRLRELEHDYEAAPGAELSEACTGLLSLLDRPGGVKPGKALHAYLDEVQVGVIRFAGAIGARYFGPD
ncbi:MAG: alpha-E domain-containing protein [Oceanicaulis sp.]